MIKKLIRNIIRRTASIKYKKLFGSVGGGSSITRPLRISHGENIHIGSNVEVHDLCWLAANPLTGEDKCQLVIEDGCVIGDFCHIYATKSIVIHKNVLFANGVYVSDNSHGFKDISIPIMRQPIVQKNPVEIGEGSWLGENVCVIGASIGKNCVIGANSVVTHDIPDYSVAVGAPAKIIKCYDAVSKSWKTPLD